MATRGKKVQVLCRNPRCGEEFSARVADVKRGWAKYCSKSCKAQHQEMHSGQYDSHQRRIEREDQ